MKLDGPRSLFGRYGEKIFYQPKIEPQFLGFAASNLVILPASSKPLLFFLSECVLTLVMHDKLKIAHAYGKDCEF
jgi:hypothetical protein